MMREIVIHIVLLFVSQCVFAQVEQLKQDLLLVQEEMTSLLPVKIKTNYTLFATHDTTGVMSTTVSNTYLSQEDYYQQIEGVHTFIHGNEVAIIDKDEETIICDQKEVDFNTVIFNLDLASIDRAVVEIDYEENQMAKVYDLKLSPYSSFSKVIIHISKAKKIISKLELFYAGSQGLEDTLQEEQSPRLVAEMQYSKLDANKKFYTLSNNPFCTIEGDEVLSKPDYKSYSIINNLVVDE